VAKVFNNYYKVARVGRVCVGNPGMGFRIVENPTRRPRQ
jgi:hypothetical protein